MKIRELREGFLDDLAAAMRGADTFGGFLKNLGGGSAKLDQLSRRFFQAAERVLVSGQTNLRQPDISDDDIPMDRLIVAVFNAAAEFSKTGKNPVSRGDLLAHFKKYQAEILKGMNMQATGANLARSGAEEINKLLARQPTAAIPGAGLDGNLESISLLAALTLLDLEFRSATDQEPTTGEAFEFTDDELKRFRQAGEAVLGTLFVPGSELHRALRVNAAFKGNMEKFIVDLLTDVQRNMVNATTKNLANMKNRLKNVVQPVELQAALTGHINFNDPSLPEGYQEAVKDMLAAQKENFDNLIEAWYDLAMLEREKTGSDSSGEAFSQLRQWGDRALKINDRLQVSAQPPTKAPARQQAGQAGGEIPAAGQTRPKVQIGGQEIKPTEPAYNKILDIMRQQGQV